MAIKECDSRKYASCLWHSINFISALALLHCYGCGLTSTKLFLATIITHFLSTQSPGFGIPLPPLPSCPTEMLKQLRAQVPALDPEFGILQDDNSPAYTFWKMACAPSWDWPDGTEVWFTCWAQFGDVPVATAVCSDCRGSVLMDMSFAPVRSHFRFAVVAILGSTCSGRTKSLKLRAIEWGFSLHSDFPWVGPPFVGALQSAPNEMSVQWGRNQIPRLWGSSQLKTNKKKALKRWKQKSSKQFFFFFLKVSNDFKLLWGLWLIDP